MNRRFRLLALGACAAATLLSGPALATSAVAAPAPTMTTSASTSALAVVPAAVPPTSNRCTNATHSVPCWALTFRAGQFGNCTGNPPGVPFIHRDGTRECLGGNDLVLIQCWFTGSPTVDGDSTQDHITRENAGGRTTVGHIPDVYIDLNGHNPGSSFIHLPGC